MKMVAALIYILMTVVAIFLTIALTSLIIGRITSFACGKLWKGLTKKECLARVRKWRSISTKLELLIFLAIIGFLVYLMASEVSFNFPLYSVFFVIILTNIPSEIKDAMQQYYTNTYSEECATSV